MKDDELITLVREQRTRIPMTTPVDEIISRGRSIRARRRIPGVAGALAAAAGAAIAMTALIPAGHQASPQPATQLAAWTVTRQTDGDVSVTLRELHDPKALAAALHADGVPVYIAFADPVPAKCYGHPATSAIYQFRQGDKSAVLVIHPSAIPGGTGLFIFDVPAAALHGDTAIPVVADRAVHISLVSATKQCPV